MVTHRNTRSKSAFPHWRYPPPVIRLCTDTSKWMEVIATWQNQSIRQDTLVLYAFEGSVEYFGHRREVCVRVFCLVFLFLCLVCSSPPTLWSLWSICPLPPPPPINHEFRRGEDGRDCPAVPLYVDTLCLFLFPHSNLAPAMS